jgi:hypothetical protein
MPTETVAYQNGLQKTFSHYRGRRFAGQDELFECRPEGGPVVFNHAAAENNLLIPPCSPKEREKIIGKIPPAGRHKHFASMLSSQALAQSVFGTIEVLDRLPLLTTVKSEDGGPAFGPTLRRTNLEFEKKVRTLGERPAGRTSIDVWFEGAYHVAVECKLAELEFGTCSRPRLKLENESYCDGNYAHQKERKERCALTEINVNYWSYVEELFGWRSSIDHRPCPLNKTCQLVRNVLAACVGDDGKIQNDRGHALIIYDQRNPAMARGGACDRAWRSVYDALKEHSKLRRLSWQAFIEQWPNDEKLNWLKEEMGRKYGLLPF